MPKKNLGTGMAISTGSASETQNAENHKMNRHKNILCEFLPHFYEIFPNNICLKLVAKSKLSPHSGSVALGQLNPIHEKGPYNFFSTVRNQCLNVLWVFENAIQ